MDVIRDGEERELKYKPGGRLDMSHGFLHHIRRNQIARDDYDKEVKQAKEKQKRRHTATPRRPRRPDQQVYHPRHRKQEEGNDSSSSTEQDGGGAELFWLDYQADCGRVTSFIVCKDDAPENVVQRVAQENVLDSAMRAVLLQRVRKEMEQRRDKR